VRTALAIGAAALVALAVVSPHAHHADPLGSNACQACVVRAGEAACAATPDVAPARVPSGAVPAAPVRAPPPGFPLGAVPGQSPPRA